HHGEQGWVAASATLAQILSRAAFRARPTAAAGREGARRLERSSSGRKFRRNAGEATTFELREICADEAGRTFLLERFALSTIGPADLGAGFEDVVEAL